VEETIGYEALFSSEEWDSLDIAEWAPEGDGPHGPDPDAVHTTALYEVREGFEIECELCGTVGTANGEVEAQAIARLHEAFVATLVEKFEVTR
jgi:hypothetical protein